VPVSRAEKEAILKELKEKFQEAKVAVFTDYRGLTVAEVTRLRQKLREAGCVFKVAKNTLTEKVVKELGYEGVESFLEGQTAIAFGIQDPVAPAKVLSDFIREARKMEIKGGLLEGRVITAEGVKGLASLPSREVLLARVLGGMQAPLYGFVTVLQGTLRSFVYALEALRKQRAGEA